MLFSNRIKLIFSPLCLVALIGVPGFFCMNENLAAQNIDWTNPSGGDFEDGSNWEFGSKPTASQGAIFTLNAIYDVQLNADETVSRYIQQSGDVTLNGGNKLTANESVDFWGGSSTVTGSGTELESLGYFLVERSSSALIKNGGTVSNQIGYVGLTGNGTVHVDGLGSQWNNTNLFMGTFDGINDFDAGFLNTVNGGTVHVGDERSTFSSSSGQLIVSDSGGIAGGNGRMHIRNGSQVNNGEWTILGMNTPDSYGRIDIDGANSELNNGGAIFVGNAGTGDLNIENGGQATSSRGYLGIYSGSFGAVSLHGVNSRWDIGGELNIGLAGAGVLQVGNNATLTNGDTYIATSSSGEGDVYIDSGGLWNMTNLFMGGTETQDGGNYAQIGNAGTVVVGDDTVSGQGLFVSDSGSNGRMVIRNGAHFNSNGTTTIGLNAGHSGSIAINQAGLSSDAITIGDRGNGSLTIENDSNAVVGQTVIGARNTGKGTVEIGTDSYLQSYSNQLFLGTSNGSTDGGVGTLNILDNGQLWVKGTSGGSGIRVGNDARIVMRNGSTMTNSAGSTRIGGGTVSQEVESQVELHGVGTRWDNISDVTLGDEQEEYFNSGAIFVRGGAEGTSDTLAIKNGRMTLTDAGSKWTTNQTSILDGSFVQVDGGRFEFGTTDVSSFGNISGGSGSLAGNFEIKGYTDIGSLDFAGAASLDTSEVSSVNSGVIYGSGYASLGLNNSETGEVRTISGQWARFGKTGNTNHGEINNFGGIVEFENDLENHGFIAGRGQYITGTGLTNEGSMAFSGGNADILGDVANLNDGTIVTSGAGTTTFYDDVIHNGLEVRTSYGSKTVFFGEMTGASSFTGTGDVFFEGDLRPGNSPDIVNFGGDVYLGLGAETFIEIAGTELGEFDMLNIGGDFSLDGLLSVDLIDGFSLDSGQSFMIADVGGFRFGEFNGLSEGALVGNYGGQNLFVSYSWGDGNDVALYTASIPEPGSMIVLGLIGGLAVLRRRRG